MTWIGGGAVFRRKDFSILVTGAPVLGVSIFLPTHVRGEQTRLDPGRLRTCVDRAYGLLTSSGVATGVATGLLAPAYALVDDYPFWQHQQGGLALFASTSEARHFLVPMPLPERVVVGPGYHLRPLLPLLAADGTFRVLTVTAEHARLYDASRFALAEDTQAQIPRTLGKQADSDYENPVFASPPARPHVGAHDISHAQVYGDSPPDWRKARMLESLRRLASAVERATASQPAPLVLVAGAEVGGHMRRQTSLGPLIAATVATDPAAMDERQLHAAAYAAIREELDASRRTAIEQARAGLSDPDSGSATSVEDVVRLARHGRVDTLMLVGDEPCWGHYDETADRVSIGDAASVDREDLLDRAATSTIAGGGTVHVLPGAELPTPVLALLRF